MLYQSHMQIFNRNGYYLLNKIHSATNEWQTILIIMKDLAPEVHIEIDSHQNHQL